MKVITTSELMRPIADFSHAAMAEGLVFVGAMAGTDNETRVAGTTPGTTDFDAQTDQIFQNLDMVLGQFGSNASHLSRLKVYLSDMRNHSAYMAKFSERFPSAAFDHVVVGTDGYPLSQAVIELDAVATVPGADEPGLLTYMSFPLSIRGRTRETLASAVRERLAGLGARADKIAFLGITLAHHDSREEVVDGLREALGDSLPPLGISVTKLGERDADAMVEVVVSKVPPELGPRVDGVRCASYAVTGNFAFLAARWGNAAEHDVAKKADQVLRNLKDAFNQAGFERACLIRTYNILEDWRDYGAFNKAYGTHVTWPFPPRTTMLAGIARGAGVQIEAVGYRHLHDVTVLQAPKTKE